MKVLTVNNCGNSRIPSALEKEVNPSKISTKKNLLTVPRIVQDGLMKNIVHPKVRSLSLIGLIVFSTIGCDQATKMVARDTLKSIGSLSFLNNMIRFEYAENPGAFLSLGANLSPSARFAIFTILAGLFLIILTRKLLSRHTTWVSSLGLAFMLGGGTGNLIDRFARGQVIDFLNIGVGNLRTGIFNVADMAICLGLLLIVLEPWLTKKAAIPKAV
jgi:signal peptidase II